MIQIFLLWFKRKILKVKFPQIKIGKQTKVDWQTKIDIRKNELIIGENVYLRSKKKG